MVAEFNASEVFELAQQIERNGAAFYRRAAEGKTPSAKDLLTKLALMEDKHQATFLAMQKELTDPIDVDDESRMYLHAFVQGVIFDPESPALNLTGKETVAQVLRVALRLETDSIAYYVGIRQLVDGKQRQQVEHILHEEMLHVAMLNDELGRQK